MPDLGTTLARKLAGITDVRQFTAVFNYLTDDGRARITFDDRSSATVPTVNSRPRAGERVRVVQVGNVTIMLGPARQRPSRGVVTAVDTTGGMRTYRLTLTNGETVSGMYSIGGAIPVGARVAILWQDEGLILGQVNDPDPERGAEDAHQAGGLTAGAADFAATWAGSYGPTWTANPLTASATRTAAWGYGTKIANSIPKLAVVESAHIWLPLQASTAGDVVPILGVHASPTQPTGAVAVDQPTPLPGYEGWIAISTAHIERLRLTSGGIAITRPAGVPTGWQLSWSGIASDPQTGTLRVSWR